MTIGNRCAGCAKTGGSLKDMQRHLITCRPYIELYKADPSSALGPKEEFERWKGESARVTAMPADDEPTNDEPIDDETENSDIRTTIDTPPTMSPERAEKITDTPYVRISFDVDDQRRATADAAAAAERRRQKAAAARQRVQRKIVDSGNVWCTMPDGHTAHAQKFPGFDSFYRVYFNGGWPWVSPDPFSIPFAEFMALLTHVGGVCPEPGARLHVQAGVNLRDAGVTWTASAEEPA